MSRVPWRTDRGVNHPNHRPIRVWWALCLLLGFLPSVHACDLPRSPDDPPDLSPFQLIEVGHDLRAKAALTPVVEADPTNANAAWLLSKALSGLEDLDGAMKFAEQSVALDGDNAAY